MRAVNLGRLPGNWSDPEILDIADIPPPSNITARQTSIAKLPNGERDEMDDITDSYRITMEVSWELPSFTHPLPSSMKRQALMPVTSYTVVVGVEEIEDRFGKQPQDSFERENLVS